MLTTLACRKDGPRSSCAGLSLSEGIAEGAASAMLEFKRRSSRNRMEPELNLFLVRVLKCGSEYLDPRLTGFKTPGQRVTIGFSRL